MHRRIGAEQGPWRLAESVVLTVAAAAGTEFAAAVTTEGKSVLLHPIGLGLEGQLSAEVGESLG